MEKSKEIKILLFDLGISPDLQGYHLLVNAIDSTLEMFRAGTTDISFCLLYKVIAARCGVTHAAVERNIRTAIAKAFKNQSITLKKLFGCLEDKKSGKVTCSCFISTIAQYLLLED